MTWPPSLTSSPIEGIRIHAPDRAALQAALQRVQGVLAMLDLSQYTEIGEPDAAHPARACIRIARSYATYLAPGGGTTDLCRMLALDTVAHTADLDREIVAAMLLSPVPFDFPNADEFQAALRIRRNIVQAARRTALAFDTERADRPDDYWTYDESTGFTLRPGQPLTDALRAATQPGEGRRYAFSCYRATEYVTLLAIAQELEHSNPPLLRRLESRWRRKAIMSGQFHDVFLREYGSMEAPLPPGYYVPGDRLWFRNPDPLSSDVEGYEGSWVMYLGNGLFTNFWKPEQPYTLASKCLELYHWRDAVRSDGNGRPYIDEAIVEERVRASTADTEAHRCILSRMFRLRDPKGVYAEGGCIDTTREHPRWVCAGSSDLVLPTA